MLADKPTELSSIKLKNLNSTARPYGQRAFSPLDPTVSWLSHLALAIYIFVVVNFDALAQTSDIQIERRQVVFLCWMQDLNQGSQTPNRQQTAYMFVVVNFDALAQASDIRIERRQVVFLCWRQDSNPRSQIPIHQQTECLLTNRLSYRGSS